LCGGQVSRQSYQIITTRLANFNYNRTLRIISANAQETYCYKLHKVAMNSFFLSWRIFSVWKQSEKLLIKKWHEINDSYNIILKQQFLSPHSWKSNWSTFPKLLQHSLGPRSRSHFTNYWLDAFLPSNQQHPLITLKSANREINH